MTAPPTLRQIITTPRESLWWSASVLLIGWALLFSSGYVVFGDSAAGPSYYVIQQSIGVTADNVVTLALGLVMLALLIIRSPWTALSLLAFAGWCAWQAVAFYAGWWVTGKGWGGGPTWTFFWLFSLLWYVASPLMMRGVPGHPRAPQGGTPAPQGSRLRRGARHPRMGTGAA